MVTQGITLVTVPFYWDRTLEGLENLIRGKRPELVKKLETEQKGKKT